MVQGPAKHLVRLAALARQLEQKRVLCMQLQARVEAAEREGVIADGEKWGVGVLRGLLEQALHGLQDLQSAEDATTAAEHIDRVQGALADAQWALADEIQHNLAEKEQAQEELSRSYEAQLTECQTHIAELETALRQALQARAPLVVEKRRLQVMQHLFRQAERALDERSFGTAAKALEALQPHVAGVPELVQGIGGKAASAGQFARQADLLLLQSPLDVQRRYTYTVLMRTPSEPGSHGINIRDSSTLVEQDRARMGERIEQITAAIDAGLARQFTLRSADGRPSEARAAPAGVGAVEAARHGMAAAADHGLALESPGGLVRQAGEFMYAVVIPEQMQRYLSSTSCALTITTNDLELPWELMYDQGGFLCLQRPVARMPMGHAFPREEVRPPRTGSKLRFLLIYSDPEGNLPAAWHHEIVPIRDALQRDWKDQIEIDVLQPQDAVGSRINEIMLSGSYDVIHYAGHAYFDKQDPDLSGLALQQGEVFFAQKIRRLLRGRPLVFLNACQSGRTANEQQPQKVDYLQKPAEGLASAFVYGGALGCIGSLWPIYDRPAADFAIHFYNKVLQGHMIGEATRLARIETRKAHPNSITWAAFVLYGDPTIVVVD